MGGKSKLQEYRRKFKQVHTWQLIIVLLPLLFLTATLLRFDHIRMTELRAEVLAADQAGDEERLNQSLESLRQFVRTHIIVNVMEENGETRIVFGTGPFYLEQSYLRAAEKAIELAEAQVVDDSNPNGNIYAAASAVCRPLAIANGWAWNSQANLDCWMNELNKYPESTLEGLNSMAKVPSTELYRLNFASPVWTLSWSGVAVILCMIVAVAAVIRLLIWLVLHLSLFFVK